MSQEVFEIVKGMNRKDIELQLALQCAPMIAGLKVANLLIVRCHDLDKIRDILQGTDMSGYVLLKKHDRVTLLLYEKKKLGGYLKETESWKLLSGLGYTHFALSDILEEFSLRYQRYMDGQGEFPHEMGLLLGYPIEDIYGFIYHQGKDFLWNGYWKVYENVSAKKKLFDRFEDAKETMIHLLHNGVSMSDIIDIYRQDRIVGVAV